ncbi:MAG: HlyC/CorC family transporter [Bacteroidia bacterium]|nr:HlyC/CorC family transporter [Bacteroidia bacterium]
MLGDLFLTFLLVFLNGFFVAAEFALVKVRSSQIDLLAQKGSKRAKVAQQLVQKLDSYLSATQLGITLASLGLGAFGEHVMSQIVGSFFANMSITVNPHVVTVPIAFTLITFFHITIGEQVPKMFGIKYPLEMTLFISWPMRIFYFVFAPFIWLLNKSSNMFLRMLGIKKVGEEDVHTEEELRLILTESEEGGAIKPSENELIQNVFDFDDRLVKQIMVPQNRVTAIDIEALDKEGIVQKISEEGFSRYPIYLGDIDNIIGVIYAKDLFKELISKKFRTIKDIMRPAHFVPESMKINDLLRDFQKLHMQIAIVTNEFGATAGIVTMEDIIEELVGEIQDEHDEEKPTVEKKSETEYIVNAHSSIGDVNESLPMALPESPKYETISGLINFLWGRIPGVNEKRHYGGYEITVLQRKKQTVESVKLRVLETEKVE